MTSNTVRPLIAISGELKDLNGFDVHAVGHKYVTSVVEGAGGIPVVLASLGCDQAGGLYAMEDLVDRLDGLVLTGGRSNIEPHHYGGEPFRADTWRDPLRDATTLPLVRAALARGLPLFGICRGIQELNVALGGSLHPYLWEVEGKRDHRMLQTDSLEERFAPRHAVHLAEGGLFARIAGEAGLDRETQMVNSLHSQAVHRLGRGVVVEALSEDGVVEGVSVPESPGLAIGVQWHAEFRVDQNPFNRALFRWFGDAARARAVARQTRAHVA
ncbi:MAG: gamma-glutamyl-gamma-aminobutyrate hydrolase family protein [Alphaproteobacteria bacterium]|jgi:putative glutamine amidotransferase